MFLLLPLHRVLGVTEAWLACSKSHGAVCYTGNSNTLWSMSRILRASSAWVSHQATLISSIFNKIITDIKTGTLKVLNNWSCSPIACRFTGDKRY